MTRCAVSGKEKQKQRLIENDFSYFQIGSQDNRRRDSIGFVKRGDDELCGSAPRRLVVDGNYPGEKYADRRGMS